MKKLLLFSVVGLLVLVLSACSSDNTPEGVTTKAIQCIIDKDYQGYIDLMFFRKEQTDHDKQQLAALVQDKMDKEMEKKQGIKDFHVGKADIVEDKAVVPYQVTFGNGEIKEDKMQLLKTEDEIWMIDSGK